MPRAGLAKAAKVRCFPPLVSWNAHVTEGTGRSSHWTALAYSALARFTIALALAFWRSSVKAEVIWPPHHAGRPRPRSWSNLVPISKRCGKIMSWGRSRPYNPERIRRCEAARRCSVAFQPSTARPRYTSPWNKHTAGSASPVHVRFHVAKRCTFSSAKDELMCISSDRPAASKVRMISTSFRLSLARRGAVVSMLWGKGQVPRRLAGEMTASMRKA